MGLLSSYFLIAWGGRGYHLQGVLAARSLLRAGAEQVTVYTDAPHLFPAPIRTRQVSVSEIRSLCGPLGFTHRSKVELIRRHVTSEPLPCLFVDSDIYCETLPQIDSGETRSLMHTNDGQVSSEFYPRLHRFLLREAGAFHRAGFSQVSPSFPMLNSGGMLFPNRPEMARDMDDVLRLTDLSCRLFPEQVEWLEQFSFNQVFAARGPIGLFPPGVLHYWGMNFEVAHLLTVMTSAEIDDVVASPEAFARLQERANALKRDPAHRRRLFIRRLKRSYRKRKTIIQAWRLNRSLGKP